MSGTTSGTDIYKVGATEQYQTLNAAIKAMDAAYAGGDTNAADIQVDAGTYVNDGGYVTNPAGPVTIEGVGGNAVIQDPSYSAGGKAAIVTEGNVTLKNLDISGVTVGDGNGAGVRYDSGDLTLDNVSLHGNQDGILGGYGTPGQGSVTIQNSEIYNNGTDAGNTHNIYIGDIGQFTLTDSYVHDAQTGHEVKSRAQNTTITNNTIADNSANSSYEVDLPNGGNATVTGNTIEQGANSQNGNIVSFAEEGASDTPDGKMYAGQSLSLTGNTVVNDDTNWSQLVNDPNGGSVKVSQNTVYGLTSSQLGVADDGSNTYATTRPAFTEAVPSGSAPVVAAMATPVAAIATPAAVPAAVAPVVSDSTATPVTADATASAPAVAVATSDGSAPAVAVAAPTATVTPATPSDSSVSTAPASDPSAVVPAAADSTPAAVTQALTPAVVTPAATPAATTVDPLQQFLTDFASGAHTGHFAQGIVNEFQAALPSLQTAFAEEPAVHKLYSALVSIDHAAMGASHHVG